jgi:hypothetical protein
LQIKETELDQFSKKVNDYAAKCQQEVISARAQAKEAEHAHKKKQNAAGAAERRKRKLARTNQ